MEDIGKLLQKQDAEEAARIGRDDKRALVAVHASAPLPIRGYGCLVYALPTQITAAAWATMFRITSMFQFIIGFSLATIGAYAASQTAAFTVLGSSSDSAAATASGVIIAAMALTFVAAVTAIVGSLVAFVLSDYAYRRQNRATAVGTLVHLSIGTLSLACLIAAMVCGFVEAHAPSIPENDRSYISLLSVVIFLGIPMQLGLFVIEAYNVFVKATIATSVGLSPTTDSLF